LDLPLKKQQNPDVSAMGAAYLAGLKSGVYESIDQIQTLNQGKTEKILPDPQNTEVIKAYKGWLSIIQK
jgi:glycerol kinase